MYSSTILKSENVKQSSSLHLLAPTNHCVINFCPGSDITRLKALSWGKSVQENECNQQKWRERGYQTLDMGENKRNVGL